jgi:predicted nucleic acid-binding protein
VLAVTSAPPANPFAHALIWDSSPLHHAIKAGKIDVLADIAQHGCGGPRRNVTTQAVISEISAYQLALAGLEWLDIVHVDDLHEIEALVEWMGRVSGSKSNHGEATVLAWAEVHKVTAVVDDGDARRIGRREGLDVWGSLRVIAESVSNGYTTPYVATTLVDAMIDTGMRYPCSRGEFISWAKHNSLL